MRNGLVRREELPSVGKGIGRDVHHAHEERPVQRQEEPAAAQDLDQTPVGVEAAGAGATCAPSVGALGVLPAAGTLGARGGLPAMMSFSCSASSVSHSSSALAIASTLSRFSSSSRRASLYCSSTMRRISWSTFCKVVSETFLCVVIERPRNTPPSFSL